MQSRARLSQHEMGTLREMIGGTPVDPGFLVSAPHDMLPANCGRAQMHTGRSRLQSRKLGRPRDCWSRGHY